MLFELYLFHLQVLWLLERLYYWNFKVIKMKILSEVNCEVGNRFQHFRFSNSTKPGNFNVTIKRFQDVPISQVFSKTGFDVVGYSGFCQAILEFISAIWWLRISCFDVFVIWKYRKSSDKASYPSNFWRFVLQNTFSITVIWVFVYYEPNHFKVKKGKM